MPFNSEIYQAIKNIERPEDQVLAIRVEKIKLRASLPPISAENLLVILTELLALKVDYKISQIKPLALNDEWFNKLLTAIKEAIVAEKNDFLGTKFSPLLLAFQSSAEADFYKSLKTLTEQYISCIDIDYVMQNARQAMRQENTRGKQGILVVGKTGAGKSFLINYIGAPNIFMRNMITKSLTVKVKKQPPFLKHIKMGESVVSETSQMGIVEIDNFTQKDMHRFHGQHTILCDTPGSGDNRDLGAELKLANILQTIAPVYKMENVRLLVTLSANAIDARGESLKNTIQFVSGMFRHADDIAQASSSIVVALSGDNSERNFSTFIDQLKEFKRQQLTLGLTDKDIAFIDVFLPLFNNKRVLHICPGRSHGSNPAQILDACLAAAPLDPKYLSSFAEAGIQESLEHEATLLTQSIDRQFESLLKNLEPEIMSAQVQRLSVQYTKLSFMDMYYAINEQNINQYFDKLAAFMNSLRQDVLDILCPKHDVIDQTRVDEAFAKIEILRELDGMIRIFVNNIFADSRLRTIALLQAMNPDVNIPENILSYDESTWFQWVQENRPTAIVEAIDDAIKMYRLSLIDRMQVLLDAIDIKLSQQLIFNIKGVMHASLAAVDSAMHNEPNADDNILETFSRNATTLLDEQGTTSLEVIEANLNEQLTASLEPFSENKNELLIPLSYVLSNLRFQNEYFSTLLFGESAVPFEHIVSHSQGNVEASAPMLEESMVIRPENDIYQKDILWVAYSDKIQQLSDFVDMNCEVLTFASAIQIIEYMRNYARYFGFAVNGEISNAVERLTTDITAAIDFILNVLDDQTGLNTQIFSTVVMYARIINQATQHPAFQQYLTTDGDVSYPSALCLQLEALQQSYQGKFQSHVRSIEAICRKPLAETSLSDLNQDIEQLWFLLSLPLDGRDSLVSDYQHCREMVGRFIQQCISTFAGQLKAEMSLREAIYQDIEEFVTSIDKQPFIEVMGFQDMRQGLTVALEERANRRLGELSAFELGSQHAANISPSLAVKMDMSNLLLANAALDESLQTRINTALDNYLASIKTVINDLHEIFANDALHDKNSYLQAEQYLSACTENGLFETEVSTSLNTIKQVIAGFANEVSSSISTTLATMQPEQEQEIATSEILDYLALFQFMQKNTPNFYAATDNVLEKWLEQLAELASNYMSALTKALHMATQSLATNHVLLLERIQKLTAFDALIKTLPTANITFKRLHKRFDNAFDAEFFGKISSVMSAVYAGKFNEARDLASQDDALTPGSDLRLLLIEQIDIFITAAMGTISRATHALAKNPVPKPNYMPELMVSYEQVNNAQSLVESGLLSKSVLELRDDQLKQLRTALDSWLSAVINDINQSISQLNFHKATHDSLALTTGLDAMSLKPDNYASELDTLTQIFEKQLKHCQTMFDISVENWHKAPFRVVDVANAFIVAKQDSFNGQSFSDIWRAISDTVRKQVVTYCEAIETNFKSSKHGIDMALQKLELLQKLTDDIPCEDTELLNAIKNSYQGTLDLIQSATIELDSEGQRLEYLQAIIASTDKFAKGLGSAQSAKTAFDFLNKTVETINERIKTAFARNHIDTDQLLIMADLHRRFNTRNDRLNQYIKAYTSILESFASTACKNINDAAIAYKHGDNATQALQTVANALSQLVILQQLETNTRDITPLVDSNLANRVAALLTEFNKLLSANSKRFQSALQARNLDELDDSLSTASAFQDITVWIEKFIIACHFDPLPENLHQLKQLNTKYSYMKLVREVLHHVKEIYGSLSSLNIKNQKQQGEKVREEFYSKLIRDLDFMHRLASNSTLHFSEAVLVQEKLEADFGIAKTLKAFAEYLESAFRLAFSQLQNVVVPTATTEWADFNRYYQELIIFVAQCDGAVSLNNLMLNKQNLLSNSDSSEVPATMVTSVLVSKFEEYLRNVIQRYKSENIKNPQPENAEPDLIALLAGLQKMAADMPVLADKVRTAIKQFLADIHEFKDDNYVTFLAVRLRSEESGFGATLVNEQSIFAGMMVAERNNMTKSQNIDYVLDHLEVQDESTGRIRAINPDERRYLSTNYTDFDNAYEALLDEYIKQDFKRSGKVLLQRIKQDLMTLVADAQPQRNNQGKIIWNDHVVSFVPKIYAYIFAIWTLHESPAFFEETNTTQNQDFLKKPHPAQIVAILQMLKPSDNNGHGFKSHLNEVLTGQGKSVVLSATTALLVMLGYAVDVGCYSEYLSERDKQSFEWLFDFLEVSDYVQYGTFNGLSEDMLNQQGDLRDVMRNTLYKERNPIIVNKHHGRETIALVDEVDSLVTAFFGHLYQPYFMLQNDKITALLDAIWEAHQQGNLTNFGQVLALPEYEDCQQQYADTDYLLRSAASQMFADLSSYRREDGHDFYVNAEGELYYKQFDGKTVSKSIGYKTYWACRDIAYNVSVECRQRHEGIKVTCGAYSYADLMRDAERYTAMLGVTGTYRELSDAEKSVVKDVFRIQGASFIPSAYGENKLSFKPGTQFHVVDDDNYHLSLVQEIRRQQTGWVNDNVKRPVLIFFETEAELMRFYKSEGFGSYRAKASLMTSETITNNKERDAKISQATRAGQVTLAIKDHGRGSDFILTDPKVIANGGMAVIDGFMPETEADERQHQGRAARQGQDGSFSMVIRKRELKEKFRITDAQIQRASDEGKLYEMISETRNQAFSNQYQSLVDESDELRTEVHEPSMALLATIHDPDAEREAIISAHKLTVPGASTTVSMEPQHARVLILFDSTGSMGDLIDALKETLQQVVTTLVDVFDEYGSTFELQIAHYEDYCSKTRAFHHTENWTCDVNALKSFIQKARPSGGGGNSSECVELGLYYANQLAISSAAEHKPLNHVILMGDEPPSSQAEMDRLRGIHGKEVSRYAIYWQAKHYETEAAALKAAEVPVSAFFIRTSKFYSINAPGGGYQTEVDFAKIAEITDGETGELDLSSPERGREQVMGLFARKIITSVAKENVTLANEMLEKFQSRVHSYSS